MAEKPIKKTLPADLPENWNVGQIIAPTGEEVQLTHQHGYNYLMEMVNRTQQNVNQINDAFESISTSAACFVVGTSQNGWTKADCDFLCDGTDDQIEINMALNALPSGKFGYVLLLPGSYYLTNLVTVGEQKWLRGISQKSVEIVRNTADGYGEKKSIINIRRGKISDFTFTGFQGVSDDTFDISANIRCDISNITFFNLIKNSIFISGAMDNDRFSRICNCTWSFSVRMAIYANACQGYFFICNNDYPGLINTFVHLEKMEGNYDGFHVHIEGNGVGSFSPGEYYLDLSGGGNIIRGNTINRLEIINSTGGGTYGNIISGNAFFSSGPENNATLLLGKNTTKWLVVGNNLMRDTVGGVINLPIIDLGEDNVIRFNSDDTSTGGGSGVAGVSRFNGRTGAVVPASGDYTAAMVGAVPAGSVQAIQTVTEAEYNALSDKSATTLYLIKE